MADWQDSVANHRARLAHESLSIPVQDLDIPSHFYRTFEVAHAYEEKLKKSSKTDIGSRYANWFGLPAVTQSDVQPNRLSRTRDSVAPPPAHPSHSHASSNMSRSTPTVSVLCLLFSSAYHIATKSLKRPSGRGSEEPLPKRLRVSALRGLCSLNHGFDH